MNARLATVLASLDPPLFVACASAPPPPPPVVSGGTVRLKFARAGQSTSFAGGSELGHERDEDDGDTLVCHVEAGGRKAVERLSRSASSVSIDQDGRTLVRQVAKGTVVFENL